MFLTGFPKQLDYNSIVADLTNLKHVKYIHDLHIWTLTTDTYVLAVHLVTGSDFFKST